MFKFIRNFFEKPTATPEPLEDAYNVPPAHAAKLGEPTIEFATRMVHEELTDVQLHLISAIALAEHKHRPRASMRATLIGVTSELLQLENTMNRLAK